MNKLRAMTLQIAEATQTVGKVLERWQRNPDSPEWKSEILAALRRYKRGLGLLVEGAGGQLHLEALLLSYWEIDEIEWEIEVGSFTPTNAAACWARHTEDARIWLHSTGPGIPAASHDEPL